MKTFFSLFSFWLIADACAGQAPAALAKSYESAAAATFASGDYEKSMEFFSKAFPYLQKDPALIAAPGILLTHATKILIQQQLPSEALGILRAIDIPAVAAKHDAIDPEQIILSKGDCFYAMNEPDSAQRYYRDAMRYIPNPGFSKYKAVAYETLANFYTGTHQYAKARPLLDTLTAATNHAATPLATRATAWFRLYQIDSATQNFRDALTHFRQYQLLHDTLTAVDKNRQLADMDSLSETEKSALQAIARSAHTSFQSQLVQSNKNRNYLLAAAGLLLVALIAFGYSRYRLRHRLAANLEALEQSKQTRLAEQEQLRREIHQRTLNQLATTITLLSTQGASTIPLTLAHTMLTNAAESTIIDMPDYFRELISCIRKGLNIQRPIVWRLDLADIKLDITQCVPLGCILELALTNAISHAFRDNNIPSSTIHISLKAEPENQLTLLIADNGAGPDPANHSTAGPASVYSTTHANPTDPVNPTTHVNPADLTPPSVQLIHTLAQQLDGQAQLLNNGLTIRVRVPYG